jgi:DNA polymerase-3 subunit gamma/tau
MYQVLHNHLPEKKDNFDIIANLDSDNQKKEFQEKIKSKLTKYLFKELNNYYINININISNSSKKDFIYTTTDKYNYLAKKNETIKTLKEKFNLDFE